MAARIHRLRKKAGSALRSGSEAFWYFAACLFAVGTFGLHVELGVHNLPDILMEFPGTRPEFADDEHEQAEDTTQQLAQELSSADSPAPSAAAKRLRSSATKKSVFTPQLVDEELQLSPLGNREFIQRATFCPDGSLIATICNQTEIVLWDAAGHQRLEGQSMAHEAAVSHVTFSPDGKLLASSSRDLSVRLWDTRTRKCMATLSHSHSVNAAAFSPDGRRIATASTDGCVYLWDARRARRIGKAMELQEPISAVAFSPDGSMLAATCYAAPCARLWNAQTQRLISELKVEGQLILGSIAFNPDGSTIAAPATDNTVRFWDSATQRPCGKELQHPENVSALAFSPDGRILATLSDSIRFWDMRSFRQIGPSKAYRGSFRSIAFSPGGRMLACDDSEDGVIFLEVPKAPR